jgi:hypothetical protein
VYTSTLARTSALVALQVNGDGLREVVAEVANVFLCKCLPCDDYTMSVYDVKTERNTHLRRPARR